MNIALTVLSQVCIMFLLIGVGFLCYKIGMISKKSGEQLSEMLLFVVIPAVIINAFQIEYDEKMVKGLILSFLFAVICHFAGILISKIVISKKNPKYRIERFSFIYGNAGFMGIPLIAAILPGTGIIYASIFLAVMNTFAWTHGVILMSGTVSPKTAIKALKTPAIISIIIGVTLFLTSFKLPSVMATTIGYISNMNTPLAMFVSGIYIARTNLLSIFTDKKIYKISVLKLLILPLVMIALFMFISPDGENKTIMIANIISAGCPTATLALLFSTKHKVEPEFASKVIAATTLYSIVTLPIVIFILDNTMGIFS